MLAAAQEAAGRDLSRGLRRLRRLVTLAAAGVVGRLPQVAAAVVVAKSSRRGGDVHGDVAHELSHGGRQQVRCCYTVHRVLGT